MQNTIIREFENNPDVVVAVYNDGGTLGESRAWLETWWSNYYLRGSVIVDETGEVSDSSYLQPYTWLPFGRGFLIDADQNVVLPLFGYNPERVIDEIYQLLGEEPEPIPAVSTWGLLVMMQVIAMVGTLILRSPPRPSC
ncbi:MAG: hypothetical protein ACYTHJ_19455 [Planctomycetota bacterium]|jgi:hypothetical protein